MKEESTLKKVFQEKDIQRARNLVKGQYGASTQTLTGYNVSQTKHKEGEVWEEGGKNWTIEDGIRVSVPKQRLAKQPLIQTCSACGKPINHYLDKKVFGFHGLCYDCVTKLEDQLIREGRYEEYEKAIIEGSVRSFVKDLLSSIATMKEDTNNKIVTEEGDVEEWGETSEAETKVLEDVAKQYQEKVGYL